MLIHCLFDIKKWSVKNVLSTHLNVCLVILLHNMEVHIPCMALRQMHTQSWELCIQRFRLPFLDAVLREAHLWLIQHCKALRQFGQQFPPVDFIIHAYANLPIRQIKKLAAICLFYLLAESCVQTYVTVSSLGALL